MNTQSISTKEARRMVLQAQGLLRAESFGRGKKAVGRSISRLSYVQIDTISVIARAHLHVLRNRVPNFQGPMLEQLLSDDRRIFEYWSHAAAYLPMEDYRFSLIRKRAIKEKDEHWFRRQPEKMAQVLERIRVEGPLQSKDFAAPDHKSGEWWDWKPAKKALEQLFHEGDLMISERRGFQKVYDLPERVLPNWVDTRFPTEEEVARHLIERCLQSQAFARLNEIVYLRRGMRKIVQSTLHQLTENQELIPLRIPGNDHVYYAFPEQLEQAMPRIGKRRVSLLSPFDNMVIQRKRLEALFGFSYQIECYLPAPKRRYGYFVLPILFGDQFVGRLDPKADRKQGKFYVRKLWIENDFKEIDALAAPLAKALQELAHFNNCPEIIIEWSEIPALQQAIEQYLD